MDNTKKPLFEQLCVIGLGLIGASFVQAVHNANHRLNTPLVGHITAADTNQKSIDARQKHLSDHEDAKACDRFG